MYWALASNMVGGGFNEINSLTIVFMTLNASLAYLLRYGRVSIALVYYIRGGRRSLRPNMYLIKFNW